MKEVEGNKTKKYTLEEKLKYPIPYKWKIQSVKGSKAQCVAYIDARDVMDLLDRALGIQNWRDSYYRDTKGSLVCKLELRVDGEWVAKEDVGTESAFESEKGEYSDAFKRAAVKWGIGRFLYDLDIKWIDVDTNKKPVDKAGKIIWDLTEHFSKEGK